MAEGRSSEPMARIKKVVRMAEPCDIPCPQSRTEELDVMTSKATFSSLNINAGGMDCKISCDGFCFQGDDFFSGGDIIDTDALVGDGEGLALYKSARLGDFSYTFGDLEAGDYVVDLHFAEIVFIDGPTGTRVFDVFIQEEKVIFGLDIYKEVGPNQPLILADLKSSVMEKEGLSIRFQGVVGKPIVCGISVRSDTLSSKKIHGDPARNTVRIGTLNVCQELNPLTVEHGDCGVCKKMEHKYDMLLKEQTKIKRALENAKLETEKKERECHMAWRSLQELQIELMRKSMHVGSLAFAVEGQVKEKSRWLSSIEDLSEKIEFLKLELGKLSTEASSYKNCVEDMIRARDAIKTITDNYADIEGKFEILKLRFIEESKERKELYNKVLELKGNIRVFCRCRPLNTTEIAEGVLMAIDFELAKDGELAVKAAHGSHKKVFKFDDVFSPEDDQEKVFERMSPLATSVLDGYNVCIFAYGQTGTGKTFTMEGTKEDRGVNYRTLAEMFRIIEERDGQYRYEITVSVMEVYNEQINDLLLSGGSQPLVASKRLEVRQVSGVHHVPGLVEARVSNMSEVWDVLQTGSKARAVGSTNANEHSSRSHCIHCVMVKGENLMTGEGTKSKLWLIDLAGSERVAKTDAQGERLKEAQSINKSLSALGDVISALATKSSHIPFRNSKLTHLLQDSLGGDSKTLMFVQISPNENDVGETLCSLNFASRVRGVELGPAKKQVDVSEIYRYKNMVEKTKLDNKSKDLQIQKMEEIIDSLQMKQKAKDIVNRNLQDKVKELELQLLIERKLARQHVDTKLAEHQLLQRQEETPYAPRSAPIAIKEQGNVLRPFDENEVKSILLTPKNNRIPHYFSLMRDKENKPEVVEEESLPRKIRRESLCPSSSRISMPPTPRRYSLVNCDTPLPPLHSTCPPKTRSRESRSSSTKKLSSIVRRSIQKKVIIRPQLAQGGGSIGRRGLSAAGVEKMRGSFGGNGRRTRRTPTGDAERGAHLSNRQQKEKQRGWNAF